MTFSKKYLLSLVAIFFVSVLIRIPTLNRPLSKHHEFCTAVALRILQIWDETGISTNHFNPVMTYPYPADKCINNYASGSVEIIDDEGNYYYTSHPPFAYYLPFSVFKFFRIRPDVLPIQLFNLFVHFLCGVGIYLILFQLISVNAGKEYAAFAGYVAYLFSPGTLWFHSNVYMADILVQLFFIYGVYYALKFSEEKKGKWLILLAIASFLMTYTSWLGLFFCATVIVISIQKRDLRLAIVVGGCGAVALLLTIFQYSQIAGWNALKQEWFVRFSERSGWDSGNLITGIAVIFKNYLTSYLPLIVAILALLFFSFRQLPHLLNGKIIQFIILSTIPVLLLHGILSNYSGHDFTTLYGGLFLFIIFGMLIHFASQKMKSKWIAAGMIVFISLSIAQYYYINRPGEHSQNGDRYADFHDIGKSISLQSADDEVVFLIGMKPSPEIIFYAGRNIKQVQDESEAMDFLKQHVRSKGVIFDVKEQNRIVLRERINLSEQH